jgi:Uncharacterised nucleotidyltransferase
LPILSTDSDTVLTAEWAVLRECARPLSDSAHLAELLVKGLDWPTLFVLAEEHGLFPLVASRLRALVADANLLLPDVERQLREGQRGQAVFTLSLTAELFRILDRFTSCGIHVLLTKGPALAARCYGNPGARQYTDLDFIVRNGDVQRATQAMLGLGYEAKISLESIAAGKSPGEYVFVQRDTKLIAEFHTERTFRYHPRPLPIEKLLARRCFLSFDGQDVPVLSVEDELVLICIHGAKHLWARLLWIADVAALIFRQSVNWNRALSAAREVCAERMLRVGLLLASEVLDARLPDQVRGFVHADAGAKRMAARIAQALPKGGFAARGLLSRAAFRIHMRGGLLSGTTYLLRLSLSPTEEDWTHGKEEKGTWMLDAATRPFRLARKYGRNEKA